MVQAYWETLGKSLPGHPHGTLGQLTSSRYRAIPKPYSTFVYIRKRCLCGEQKNAPIPPHWKWCFTSILLLPSIQMSEWNSQRCNTLVQCTAVQGYPELVTAPPSPSSEGKGKSSHHWIRFANRNKGWKERLLLRSTRVAALPSTTFPTSQIRWSSRDLQWGKRQCVDQCAILHVAKPIGWFVLLL